MTQVFTPPVDPTYRTKVKSIARKLVANFGDGYTQRIKDGIKTQQEVWDLTWEVLTSTNAETIMEFFEAQGEVNAFTWTNPRGTTKNYVATTPEWTYDSYNNNTITVTFSEDLNAPPS